MNILVTGGCGYVGSVVVRDLLKWGCAVHVVDNEWFGNHLPAHLKLTVTKADIRDIPDSVFASRYDAVLHLANIANDPAVDLNPTLSWEVNVLAGKALIEKSIKSGAKKFVFASSGSVYGVSERPRVTEDEELLPISAYNETKMIAERLFLSYQDQIEVFNVRPATVCGISPRMRLDVAVNLLTYQALSKRKITVLGGAQIRPNIHIDDMSNLYLEILTTDKIPGGTYNAGFENLSILQIAELIANKIKCELEILPSNDQRSYRQDSSKLLGLGFSPKKDVRTALEELEVAYGNGLLDIGDVGSTVKWMKQNKFE